MNQFMTLIVSTTRRRRRQWHLSFHMNMSLSFVWCTACLCCCCCSISARYVCMLRVTTTTFRSSSLFFHRMCRHRFSTQRSLPATTWCVFKFIFTNTLALPHLFMHLIKLTAVTALKSLNLDAMVSAWRLAGGDKGVTGKRLVAAPSHLTALLDVSFKHQYYFEVFG